MRPTNAQFELARHLHTVHMGRLTGFEIGSLNVILGALDDDDVPEIHFARLEHARWACTCQSRDADLSIAQRLDLARVRRGWYHHTDYALQVVRVFRRLAAGGAE